MSLQVRVQYQYATEEAYPLMSRVTDGNDTALSPWTALEYCSDVSNVTDTWVCHAPESCGCEWNNTADLLILQPRGCKEMGTDARVALYAPSTLAPWISLPTDHAGSRTYYSGTTVNGTSTWVSTAIVGCKWQSMGSRCEADTALRNRHARIAHTTHHVR